MFNNAFHFLTHLKENNNRDWFADNKSTFETAKKDALKSFNEIYNDLSSSNDTLEPLKVFRIYRDVRFSHDKSPYKTHFSMYFGRLKPNYRGGYYLHIEPGDKSFIGVGFFDPNKEDLLRIRKEIELDDELQIILNTIELKQFFPKLEGDELKTAPKGFDKTHQRIDLLRKKQFLLMHKLTDNEVLNAEFNKKAVTVFKAAQPFIDYMTDVLTTNLNGEKE